MRNTCWEIRIMTYIVQIFVCEIEYWSATKKIVVSYLLWLLQKTNKLQRKKVIQRFFLTFTIWDFIECRLNFLLQVKNWDENWIKKMVKLAFYTISLFFERNLIIWWTRVLIKRSPLLNIESMCLWSRQCSGGWWLVCK